MNVLAVSLPLGWRLTIYLAAGIAAGISNGIAGGGTFITFPTMLALGVPAIQANVSSTVGVLPSYLGGLRGFRDELRTRMPLVRRLLPACLIGTAFGTALLLRGSPTTFRAPFKIWAYTRSAGDAASRGVVWNPATPLAVSPTRQILPAIFPGSTTGFKPF